MNYWALFPGRDAIREVQASDFLAGPLTGAFLSVREYNRYVAPSGGRQETSGTSEVVTAVEAVKGDICQTVWQYTHTQKKNKRERLFFIACYDF